MPSSQAQPRAQQGIPFGRKNSRPTSPGHNPFGAGWRAYCQGIEGTDLRRDGAGPQPILREGEVVPGTGGGKGARRRRALWARERRPCFRQNHNNLTHHLNMLEKFPCEHASDNYGCFLNWAGSDSLSCCCGVMGWPTGTGPTFWRLARKARKLTDLRRPHSFNRTCILKLSRRTVDIQT
jgi:hypothetical protein